MSTKLDQFNAAKARLAQAERYFAKFDHAGWMNETGVVRSCTVKEFTIYHQAYAGATNYHEADDWLLDYIGGAVCSLGEQVRQSVLANLWREVEASAKEARTEADAVLAAVS